MTGSGLPNRLHVEEREKSNPDLLIRVVLLYAKFLELGKLDFTEKHISHLQS